MLSLLTGQTEDGAATGALAKNVGGGIGRKGRSGFSAELAPNTEPGLVFFPTAGNIPRKEAVHGNDQQDQRQGVQNDGYDPQRRDELSQKATYCSQKQEDHFNGEQSVIQIIRSVSSAQKASQFCYNSVSVHRRIPFA